MYFGGREYENRRTRPSDHPKGGSRKICFLPYIEVEFVPEESGVLLRKRAHRSSPVDKVYGILKRKAKTDPILAALRGR
jgi:hypothetical protein